MKNSNVSEGKTPDAKIDIEKVRPLSDMSNQELLNALVKIDVWFPSLNFNTEIDVVSPDGSATVKMSAEAAYDKELFDKLLAEISNRIKQLAKYQELDMSIKSDDDIFHKLLNTLCEVDDIGFECHAQIGDEFYHCQGDFEEGDYDAEHVDRILIFRQGLEDDE